MKCVICGIELSPRVLKIHEANCITYEVKMPVKPVKRFDNMSYNELRQLAKDKNLSLGKTPSKEQIISALEKG
jgi:hypothetical protein